MTKPLNFGLILLLTICMVRSQAQPSEMIGTGMFYFRNLDVSDGLTSNFVTSIHEDGRGFKWIGTQDGLVRFDGVSFEPFLHNPNDSNSIGLNHIAWDIGEDAQGRLWIALYGRGFSRYDPRTGHFTSFTFSNGKLSHKWADHIQHFMFDANGNTYMNSVDGILKIDSADNISILSYPRSDTAFSALGQLREAGLYKNRWIWMTSTKGLVCYDIQENEWEFWQHDPRKRNAFAADWLIHSGVFDNGKIWFSTFIVPNSGQKRYLYNFDIEHNVLDSVLIAPKLPRSHPYSDQPNDILVHTDGTIWLATEGLGLLAFSPQKKTWTQYSGSVEWDGNMPPGPVKVLYEDREGNLWIGTERGISLMASQRQYFKNYPQAENGSGATVSLSGIGSIVVSEEDIWLGKLSQGLIHLNSDKKLVQQITSLDIAAKENSGYIEPLLMVSDTLICHVWYDGLRGY
ncbi:MAG: hypothetical protein JKX84_10805, partial [Flavobacteriales bacterium]|nr:hypothetical protein [Flavobacteriales bacterium]